MSEPAFIAMPDIRPDKPGASKASPASPLFEGADPPRYSDVDLGQVKLESVEESGPLGHSFGEDDVGLSTDHRSGYCCSFVPGPPHTRNIIFMELLERFTYYSIRALMVLYLTNRLHYSDHTAVAIFSYFSAVAYMTPLLGGYVADTYLGKYRTILLFSVVYFVGSASLSVSAIWELRWGAFLGLGLIAIGTGGIKPCVSAFGAEQTRDEEVGSYFRLFYLVINVGSLFSYVCTPLARKYVSYWFAFGLSTIGLAAALALFYSARRKYHIREPSGSVLSQMTRIMCNACRSRRAGTHLEPGMSDGDRVHWLDWAKFTNSTREVDDTKAVLRVLPVFACLPVFWALFDQQGSTWTLQADRLDLYGLEPEQLGVLNPLFVMVFIPLVDRIILPVMHRCPSRLKPTPLRRMSVGMFVTAASFVAAAFLQDRINKSEPNSVSVLAMLPQYAIITFGEVLVSTTGLEWSFTEAPSSLKGVIMAAYLLTNSIGDLTAGLLFTALHKLSRVQIFVTFAGLMCLSALVFIGVAIWYTPRRPARAMADQIVDK